jgi:hypothetical protein
MCVCATVCGCDCVCVCVCAAHGRRQEGRGEGRRQDEVNQGSTRPAAMFRDLSVIIAHARGKESGNENGEVFPEERIERKHSVITKGYGHASRFSSTLNLESTYSTRTRENVIT